MVLPLPNRLNKEKSNLDKSRNNLIRGIPYLTLVSPTNT